MEIVYAVVLTVLNFIWLCLVPLGIPGTWLMVAGAGVLMWYTHGSDDGGMISVWVLVVVCLLAVVGEVLETLAMAKGAGKAGSSWRGTVGAILGAIIGGICFTGLVPIPIIGTIIGVCLGAFVGAMGMEMLGGKALVKSAEVGKGAAVGRFWGITWKMLVSVIIWVVLGVAVFWP